MIREGAPYCSFRPMHGELRGDLWLSLLFSFTEAYETPRHPCSPQCPSLEFVKDTIQHMWVVPCVPPTKLGWWKDFRVVTEMCTEDCVMTALCDIALPESI